MHAKEDFKTSYIWNSCITTNCNARSPTICPCKLIKKKLLMARSPCPLGTNQICNLESYIRRSHYKFVVFSGKQAAAIEKLIITASGITKGCKLRLDCYFIGQKLLLLSWKIVLGNMKIVAVTCRVTETAKANLKSGSTNMKS